MSYGGFYDQMAPLWDFIADLEERGPARGWFGRRGGPARAGAAGRTQVAGANTEAPVNPWEGGAAWGFGAMPHRHRHGHGHGHGPAGRRHARRQQQAEAPVENEKAGVLTPETTEAEKPVEAEKFPVVIQSDSENQVSGSESKRRPGARGGRAGRGGRGNGMGRARRPAAAKEAVSSDTEKTLSGDEAPKAVGPRRGGRGGRGMGRGAAAGAAYGPFHGTPFQGMGPRMRRRALIQALHAEMLAHQATMHPRGQMHGPMRGGRGAGLAGRGRGAMMARNMGVVRDGQNQSAGNGLRQGPGPRRGGANARGGPAGRGMGAGRGRGAGCGPARGGAAIARGVYAGNGPAAFAPRVGPAARRQNQGLAQGQNQGPKQQRNQGPKNGPAGPRKQRPGQAGPAKKNNGVFHPLVDVYHHPEAYIIHMSLPGAKKEDIEVNWNSEKSVVIVSGRIERQGDEELLKTLAKKERRIGDFKRRVKLPPTLIDVESISAKMDNGVLKVEVPRLDGFVEVKKVEIV